MHLKQGLHKDLDQNILGFFSPRLWFRRQFTFWGLHFRAIDHKWHTTVRLINVNYSNSRDICWPLTYRYTFMYCTVLYYVNLTGHKLTEFLTSYFGNTFRKKPIQWFIAEDILLALAFKGLSFPHVFWWQAFDISYLCIDRFNVTQETVSLHSHSTTIKLILISMR